MKLAISTTLDTQDCPFDPRFGRAAHFCIVDLETDNWESYPNPAINATGGAGVQASQFVVEKDAQVVISGDFGPNAYMTLSAASVRMFLAPAGEQLAVREVIDRFQAGQLEEVEAPTHAGHHGKGR